MLISGLILIILIFITAAIFVAGGDKNKKDMTTTKSKLIRTIYLYVAALVSLIFVAVGTGTILNTALKAYVFPKAEKANSVCNSEPPVYGLENSDLAKVANEEQKKTLENLINDYNEWKTRNSGEECYSQQRQSSVVDAITMLIIALPICLFHWWLIKKDKKEKE